MLGFICRVSAGKITDLYLFVIFVRIVKISESARKQTCILPPPKKESRSVLSTLLAEFLHRE